MRCPARANPPAVPLLAVRLAPHVALPVVRHACDLLIRVKTPCGDDQKIRANSIRMRWFILPLSSNRIANHSGWQYMPLSMSARPTCSFNEWRLSLGYSRKQAADALGYRPRIIRYYDTGVKEPHRVVRWAMLAISNGLSLDENCDEKSATAA